MACPDAPNAEDGRPDTTNAYAEEGTAAHELLELALRLDVPPHELATDDTPEDMADAVTLALDYMRGYLATTPGAVAYPELRLDILPEHDIFGHSDMIIVADDEVVVLDYKHGYLLVTEWTQHALYAIGARRAFGVKPQYRLVVVQPRARHIAGPVRERVFTNAELDAVAARAREAALVSAEPALAYRKAGDWCRYCRAAPVCPTLAEHVLSRAAAEFTSVDLLDVTPTTPAPAPHDLYRLAAALRFTATAEFWARAVRDYALSVIRNGGELPGYKLVKGRSTRQWSDRDAVKMMFEISGVDPDAYAPRALISPAGADKLNKARRKRGETTVDVSQYVRRSDPPITLAPVTDPRPAVTLTPGAEFQSVSFDQED